MGWKSSGLHAAFMGRSKIGGEEAAADLDRETTAMGVVAELVFADFADGEIAGFRMGEHQAGDTGMGLHGTTLRETDADLFHVYQIVDDEVQAGVGQ